ncbi:MAG: hypothetical protein JWR09_2619 [Mucilaginibacter sp.]|nr:hypothetical protein [Mucilaginibacter sp.]
MLNFAAQNEYLHTAMGFKLRVFERFIILYFHCHNAKKRITRGVASTYIVTTDFNPLAIKSRQKRTIGSVHINLCKILPKIDMHRADGTPYV